MRPLVAVTGRRLGTSSQWPYTGAAVLPQGYVDALQRAGAQPAIVDCRGDDRDASQLLDRVDAVVLTGGPDVDPTAYGARPHPKTYGVDAAADEFEIALAREALSRHLPLLAICRGLQVLNVAFGGTLHQHIVDDSGVAAHGRPGVAGGERVQPVTLDDDALVAQVMGTTRPACACHHHQSAAKIGDGLAVVGRAGDGIVEALAHDDAWLLAVQWHPEDTAAHDPAQQRLFDALVSHTLSGRRSTTK